MKSYLMNVQNVNIRTLSSGDKNCDITLRALEPKDITELSALSGKMMVNVVFIEAEESPEV